MKLKGAEGFETYYSQTLGSRWADIKQKLLSEAKKVALLNPFHADFDKWQGQASTRWNLPVYWLESPPTSSQSSTALSPFYYLDLASVFAALALPQQKQCTWLDLCAAPGGKTLTRIFADNGKAITYANDSSNSRIQRLKAVLHDYLPPHLISQVHISVCDGDRFRPSKGVEFDQILVDAPCSGERHLLSDPKALGEWSETRSKGLAIRQHSLLCHALDIVKTGGHIVYSTCSLSPLENDAVIEKLSKKRRGQFQVLEAPLWIGERTKFGVEIIPDRYEYGPIYYALIQKI